MKTRIAAYVAFLLVGTIPFMTSAQSPAPRVLNGRKFTQKRFENMPVAIKEIRNLNKGEDWLRDLEIEVQNVSSKPIYFISILVEFPDIPPPPARPTLDGHMPARVTTGFTIKYGNPELVNISTVASADDVFLQPGERYIFKVPESRVLGLAALKRNMGVSEDKMKNINLQLNVVNFGDGTGYMTGTKIITPKSVLEERSREPLPSKHEIFRKVKWGSSAALQSDPCGSSTDCYQYRIESHAASCTDSSTPPVECPQDLARVHSGEPCSRPAQDPFPCGNNQPCYDEIRDTEGCPTPTPDCIDNDEDGYGVGVDCLGDDCDDNDPNLTTNCGIGCTPGQTAYCISVQANCYNGLCYTPSS